MSRSQQIVHRCLAVATVGVVFAAFFAGDPMHPASARAQTKQGNLGVIEHESADLILQRQKWFYEQRAFPLGHIPAGRGCAPGSSCGRCLPARAPRQRQANRRP